ncbi:hypothetical protein C8F04DRAFT_1112921 [Mycena alexandri]|uniref:Uncharacterized protein n=1 Tax=Mycena alexandri TaxID=1745969 RepID=A0AAD6X0W8_9AGAR|nr:hypothetical protein C8F04DRAFT_1112921 [Mycena alexandri]
MNRTRVRGRSGSGVRIFWLKTGPNRTSATLGTTSRVLQRNIAKLISSSPAGTDSGAYKIITGAAPPVPINATFAAKFVAPLTGTGKLHYLDLRAQAPRCVEVITAVMRIEAPSAHLRGYEVAC